MSTASVTFRTTKEAAQRLEQLAQATDRSKSWHLEEALKRYLDLQSWQVDHIQQGFADLQAGRVVDHEKVGKWLETWGTDQEGDPPK